MAFTKRMSERWQALGHLPARRRSGTCRTCAGPRRLPVPDDAQRQRCGGVRRAVRRCTRRSREEWYLTGDQRHRVTFNGIWDVGCGFQLSGLYIYGDNGWATPTSGVDAPADRPSGGRAACGPTARSSRATASTCRRCTASTCALQKRFAVGRIKIDGIVEVFNVFNHANYGSFTLNESSASFGQPTREPERGVSAAACCSSDSGRRSDARPSHSQRRPRMPSSAVTRTPRRM